jgi:hypothetical protein
MIGPDRVSDGVNGDFVPAADSVTLLADAELRRRMARAAGEEVAGQTPHLRADAFAKSTDKILSLPRVRDTRIRRGPCARRVFREEAR